MVADFATATCGDNCDDEVATATPTSVGGATPGTLLKAYEVGDGDVDIVEEVLKLKLGAGLLK